jgi:hypothetical protein
MEWLGEAGSGGDVELGAAAASSWTVVASSSGAGRGNRGLRRRFEGRGCWSLLETSDVHRVGPTCLRSRLCACEGRAAGDSLRAILCYYNNLKVGNHQTTEGPLL